jgi:uncharacterized sodium:solute symporter family permease YidK
LSLNAIDICVVVAYLVGITLVGPLSVRPTEVAGDECFLAGRSLRWPAVGAALFASNISTIHLVELTTWPNPLRVIFHDRLTGGRDPCAVAAVSFVFMLTLYFIFH